MLKIPEKILWKVYRMSNSVVTMKIMGVRLGIMGVQEVKVYPTHKITKDLISEHWLGQIYNYYVNFEYFFRFRMFISR